MLGPEKKDNHNNNSGGMNQQEAGLEWRAGSPGREGAGAGLGEGSLGPGSFCAFIVHLSSSPKEFPAGLRRIGSLACCCIYAMQFLPFRKLDLHATGVCHW